MCSVLCHLQKESCSLLKRKGMFLNYIVTGNKLWCHYHVPTSEQSSLTWQHRKSANATKTRSNTSAGKMMLTLFFDISGPVLVKWMRKGTTINAAQYIDTLMKLHSNIKNCWKGRLNARIMLLHNMGPYTVGLTQSMLITLKFEVLVYLVCSRVLSSCDYGVFGSLKKYLEVERFSADKEVKKMVKGWMLQVGAEF